MNQSFIKTYGCQMNEYDSEKIDELLIHKGFKKAKNFERSDIAILNTCHIRKKASEKFYSDLGRLSIFKKNQEKLGKKIKIIVMGCVAQAEGEEVLKRNSSVDYVVGPQNIQVIPKLVASATRRLFTPVSYVTKNLIRFLYLKTRMFLNFLLFKRDVISSVLFVLFLTQEGLNTQDP